jgi:Fe-S-cluster containining protein
LAKLQADDLVTNHPAPSPCLTCGACCSYSDEWPRFSTESDEALARIPARFVDTSLARMRCIGARCAALVGTVGEATSCAIYDLRPDVCRACLPGDDECRLARARHGLLDIPPP